jgi:hypothetical protein
MSFLRSRKDAALIKTTALPAQNANNNSASIDLGETVPESVQLELSVPATPSLADGQTLTFAVQDSADDVTFAAVAGLSALVMTGAGGAGSAAASRVIALPPSVRRYVRINQAASATAGNNTAVSSKLSLLF